MAGFVKQKRTASRTFILNSARETSIADHMPEKRTSFSYKLDAAQQKRLVHLLRTGNYPPFEAPYVVAGARAGDSNVALYTSGKCVVQGKDAADFVTFFLEPVVLQAASLGYEDVLNPDAVRPHMGIDESGKGDFFGPLVIAAAYVDESLAQTMRDMDVKDSKSITSDSKALDMGRDLRKLLGRRHSIVKIGPEAYNRLYAKIRNVNTLLAWGHARAIENLLAAIPDCPRAISDQFGSKEQVLRALMQKGAKIELIQRHKAESDLAVAAASVIAREQFLRSLWDMGQKLGVKIPKGASDAVRGVAVEIGRARGPGILPQLVKCHFKTTDVVLSELKTDRTALGPLGAVRSRPVTNRRSFHRSAHAPDDAGGAPEA